jgi:hypothetical protein
VSTFSDIVVIVVTGVDFRKLDTRGMVEVEVVVVQDGCKGRF